jgi:xanthine dehydrogenase accessory factor
MNMNDFFETLGQWITRGETIALTTVVRTWGSSPRGIGAKMAVNSTGEMVGSVSGGCVEAAVVQESMEVLKTGKPKLIEFRVSDAQAFDVGLACGGEIEIFIREINLETHRELDEAIDQGEDVAIVTEIKNGGVLTGKDIVITEKAVRDGVAHSHIPFLFELAFSTIENRSPQRKKFVADESVIIGESLQIIVANDLDIFIDLVLQPPRLIIVGGVHIAIPLVNLAKIMGFQTMVVDPRKQFGNRNRFPTADVITNDWPQNALHTLDLNINTAAAVLTHDPKIDDPALEVLLNSPVFYIGALGSKKTQEERRQRMRGAGFSDDQLNRIHGPIGLDLGSKSPEEIALGIMAEIIQAKNQPEL